MSTWLKRHLGRRRGAEQRPQRPFAEQIERLRTWAERAPDEDFVAELWSDFARVRLGDATLGGSLRAAAASGHGAVWQQRSGRPDRVIVVVSEARAGSPGPGVWLWERRVALAAWSFERAAEYSVAMQDTGMVELGGERFDGVVYEAQSEADARLLGHELEAASLDARLKVVCSHLGEHRWYR